MICEGYFQNEEEIENSPKQTFGDCKPGDLKYKDVNNDGVINNKDQVELGKWAAPFYYGINLTLKWKQFTLFAAGTGSMGAKFTRSNDWRYNQQKYTSVVRGRWTEATAETATYPRLTAKDNSNSFRTSTYWLSSADRFDLNKVQLTCDMPNEWFKNKVVKGMSVYFLGESLLTISKHRKYFETSYGSPSCRFYNLGVKMNF